jgi:hypothetical protein
MLATFPRSGRVERGSIRSFAVSRVPYRLVYEVFPEWLLVLAVARTSRDPGCWLDRR